MMAGSGSVADLPLLGARPDKALSGLLSPLSISCLLAALTLANGWLELSARLATAIKLVSSG